MISVSGSTGASLGLNTYDEYGKPGASNLGRYQYTGQKWIGEANVYDYKAHDYLPHLGIFAQTDPVGQVDSPNLYAYVLGDPLNLVDPLGLACGVTYPPGGGVVITACENGPPWGGSLTGGLAGPVGSNESGGAGEDIIITGKRLHPGPQPKPPPLLIPAIAAADPGQPLFCETAWTPSGETKGENPRPGRGGYNTDLPGSWSDAIAVFVGLSRLAGDTGLSFGGLLEPGTVARSEPSGIRLRWKLTEPSSPRIDIPAGTFDLRTRETIHFRGGKGNMCPIR